MDGRRLIVAGGVATGFAVGVAVGDFAARWQGFDGPQTVPMVAAFVAWAGLFVAGEGWRRRRLANTGP